VGFHLLRLHLVDFSCDSTAPMPSASKTSAPALI